MDDDVAAAITAAQLPPGTAAAWFTLVLTAHQRLVDSGAAQDREHFGELLATMAADHFVDPHVPAAFLAAVPDMDVVRRLCALGSDLPVRYEELRRAGTAHPLVDEDVEHAGPWQRLLARYGREWSAWDGSDEGWAGFRDWFYTVAHGFDDEAYAEAYHRLQPLNDVDAAERIARLRDWGFPITAELSAEPPAPTPRRTFLSRLRPHH